MISQTDAERLKAFITATWMGVVNYEQGSGGCPTCGFGAHTYPDVELETVRDWVDQFVASKENV